MDLVACTGVDLEACEEKVADMELLGSFLPAKRKEAMEISFLEPSIIIS